MPTKSLVLILILALLTPPISRGASTDPSLVVSFYKTPESPFRSGETLRRDLEKKWISDQFQFSYLIQSEKKQKWIPAEYLARDLHLSLRVRSEKTQLTYRVLKIEQGQIWGESEDQKSQVWLPLQEVTPVPEDLGLAMTLTSCSLRKSPSWRSPGIMSVPPKTRLRIVKMEDTNWALVEFESIGKIQGWVDLNNVLTKFDFASFAMTSEKKWLPVSYRQGSELVTPQQKRIPLHQVTALMTKTDLGISLVTSNQDGLALRQNKTILKVEAQTWSRSFLPGHGEIYWKKNPQSSLLLSQTQPLSSPLPEEGQLLTTEDLLKREVTSASFHPQHPSVGIASSQGIYLTLDGKLWKRLSQFKNQNHAVLVDAQSVFYVGSFRSFDLGKTFHPFFRLDSLARLIQQKQRHPPNRMRISSLSIPRTGILQMEVETDLGRMTLAARNSADTVKTWDFN